MITVQHIDLLLFLNLFFGGLLAGLEIGVHYGLGAPPESLREDAQILLRQAMVRRLRILAPLIFFPTLVSGIAVVILEGRAAGLWAREVGLAALLVWIVLRVVRTVPVNSATLEWKPESPPPGWRDMVKRTERFHVIAAWAAVVAFLCSLLSTFQR